MFLLLQKKYSPFIIQNVAKKCKFRETSQSISALLHSPVPTTTISLSDLSERLVEGVCTIEIFGPTSILILPLAQCEVVTFLHLVFDFCTIMWGCDLWLLADKQKQPSNEWVSANHLINIIVVINTI